MLLTRDPQQVHGCGDRIEHALQPAAADHRHGKARRARGIGGGLTHGVDGLIGQPREVRPAMHKRVGAADQQPVDGGGIGAVPCHWLDFR